MNPLARKRWIRFRSHRRGFWSLCILLSLYVVSLFSEFVCNDRPLFVRFEGRSYFPAFLFYPDDTFTGSGLMTRPDYKKINSKAAFAAGTGNTMVFAPFPYGPYEIVDTASLRGEERVTVSLRPVPRLGSVNVDRDLKVTRSQSADYFTGDLAGRPLTDLWDLPGEVLDGIAARFDNRDSPSLRVTNVARRDNHTVAEVSLPAFSTRRAPPVDVRITFKEAAPAGVSDRRLLFDPARELVKDSGNIWPLLSTEQQTVVTALVDRCFTAPVSSTTLSVADTEYAVDMRLNDIQWPFRPTKDHVLGIDSAGRDVLARILYGLRTSMTFGLLLVVFSMGVGSILGAVQGYFGGMVDLVAQRLIEVWSTIPFLYVMILLGSMYGRSFSLLLFCYGIFNWIGISYYVRAEFFRLRHMPFVDAARCLGISPARIMFRHVMPNALTPIITFFPFSLVGAIGSLAVLDFLGFGLPPPTPSWGELLQQAQAFRWAWWLILYPSLALFVVMLLGVFIGEGVRDAYDPKPVMRME